MTIAKGVTAGALLLLSACAGTGGGPADRPVRIITAEDIADCRNVGSVHVSVIDKLVELQQVEGAVAAELLKLAKQGTRQLGGNAMVEMTNIIDGRQSFEAFDCP